MRKMKKLISMIMISALMGLSLMLGACSADTSETGVVRIGGLKGPTSMGLLYMKEVSENAAANGATSAGYEFAMATSADELLPMIIKGELDIALVPTNVAAILYNKTEGNIAVIDVNTLGVLSIVTADPCILSIADLKGKTIYMTGKGTTPEYSLRYVLEKNGLNAADVTLEFKSEPTEVASVLSSDDNAVGLLPQPFVTAACASNDKLRIAVNLADEWEDMVTGVTVVRKDFLEKNHAAVTKFIDEHKDSVVGINLDPEHGASLAVEASIVAKEPIALKAIPNCNIVCIDGTMMKDMVSSYLEVLFEKDPSSVGGKLPGEDFYFVEN